MQEVPYPDEPVTCVCGETFRLYWNGGELDQHDCKCGRKYYGHHRETVMVIIEPGELD